ncbi:ABC transporter ATP-binding protein [Clostridium akagii]|uniref:ABC transporter ATP-binding protein n=1 Tax=Clostridium akagii TaxID=91623 RepID=UPI0004795EC3|nr:ATP-binding cassette domain-containing protein [Clostridium akagii]
MNEFAIKTINLSKKFGNAFVVENLSINIKVGEIYGFIGKNGAGKTTTIRMITGVAAPSSGEIQLFNNHEQSKKDAARKRIGVLIDQPALYPNMTYYENLEVNRLQRGIPGRECIEEVSDLLGLEEYENKKVKNYSLGMKQKLGMAIALLGNPELLILDEPINGLDPVAIVEIRELLKTLRKERNMTILISSHNLGELYQLATCFGIIHKGRLLEELTLKELDEKCKISLNIKVDDTNKAVLILENQLNTQNFKVLQDNTIKLYDYVDDVKTVSKILTSNGVNIEQLVSAGDSLEDYFVNLIGGASR